jgi:hypothetical protein
MYELSADTELNFAAVSGVSKTSQDRNRKAIVQNPVLPIRTLL